MSTSLPFKTSLILGSLFLFQSSFGQTDPEYSDAYYDSLLNSYLSYDSLLLSELENDTISFLDLIDSLVSTDYRPNNLAVRLGYTSSILHAGRDFGVQQYGFSTGATYYHKSGLFFDALGYWNSDIDPNYYLTTLSAGFIGSISKQWSYSLSYDRFFYNQGEADIDIQYPFTNAANAATYIDLKYISAGLDYSFLFGEEVAHRLRPNILGIIRVKKKMGIIDRMTFMPGVSALLGNSTILNTSTNYQLLQQIIRKIGLRRFRQVYQNNPEKIDSLIFQSTSENVFGMMNYSLVLPAYIYMGKATVLASYSLNFPVALPGENIDTTTNSYFGITFLYNFYF